MGNIHTNQYYLQQLQINHHSLGKDATVHN